jgi:hypothetical protein
VFVILCSGEHRIHSSGVGLFGLETGVCYDGILWTVNHAFTDGLQLVGLPLREEIGGPMLSGTAHEDLEVNFLDLSKIEAGGHNFWHLWQSLSCRSWGKLACDPEEKQLESSVNVSNPNFQTIQRCTSITMQLSKLHNWGSPLEDSSSPLHR